MSTQQRATRVVLALGLTLGTAVASSVALASELSILNGRWSAAETADEAKRRKDAINKASGAFPFFARGKAKAKLEKSTAPADTLEIRLKGDSLTLTRAGKSLDLAIGGPPKVLERDGKKATIRALRKGESLVVKTEGGEGVRTAVYRPTGPKHFRLRVRMEGGRLKSPLLYEQTYVRQVD